MSIDHHLARAFKYRRRFNLLLSSPLGANFSAPDTRFNVLPVLAARCSNQSLGCGAHPLPSPSLRHRIVIAALKLTAMNSATAL